MTGKRDARREDLRRRLIAAAAARIEAGGLRNLGARDVTSDAGCALGSLYTAFKDLDDLVVHVNSVTLARLGAAISAAREGADGPVDTLKAMALAYLAFARQNHALWIALFDYAALAGMDIPDWHREEQAILISNIAGPVAALNPGMSEGDLAVRSRTLFAAVHGIVSISLEERFIGIPQTSLEGELIAFVDQMVAGLNAADAPLPPPET